MRFAAVGVTFPATKVGGKTMPDNDQERDEFSRPRPPNYYVRATGWQAICFHCRLRVRTEERRYPIPGQNGERVFRRHSDVERYGNLNGEVGKPGRYRDTPRGEEECPGSGTMPIPLAYKFPDGAKLPHYY